MPKARKSKKIKQAVGLSPAELVDLARANPYLHRLAEDPSIRENAQRAFDSARRAIDRLNHAKNPAKALIEDRKLQSELRNAIEAIRDASIALTEAPGRTRARRGCRARRVAVLGVLGGVGALAASEGLRGKVLDLLFGAEEEFQYTPPADYGTAGDSASGASAHSDSAAGASAPAADDSAVVDPAAGQTAPGDAGQGDGATGDVASSPPSAGE